MDLQLGKNHIRILSDPVVENKTFPNGPSTIFSWKVWDYATGKVRVLSKGASFLRKFDFFTEAWGEELPMKCDIIIQKTGAGLATTYDFAAVPIKDEMSSDWQQQANAIDFKQLKPDALTVDEWDPKTGNSEPPAPSPTGTPTKEDVIIEDVGDEPITLDDIPF